MRLFVAILLEPAMTGALVQAVDRLKQQSQSGRFSPPENHHLTLAFLGEVPPARVAAVRRAMDQVTVPPFTLHTAGWGRFPRSGADIWWIGLKREPALEEVHRQLSAALRREGFALEDRAFRPHLTLGREVVLCPGVSPRDWDGPGAQSRVDSICLMESCREGGRMVYRSRYRRRLTTESQ